MLLTVYLCGWLVTTIGALVAVNWFSDRRTLSPLARGSLAVLAGVLWPVLAVGLAELVAIVIASRRMRTTSARKGDCVQAEDDAAATTEYQAPGVVSAR
jgi:hypothetical protein